TSPAGWPRIAAESLSFQREDETRSLAVSLTPPGGVRPGAFRLVAAARGSDGRLSDGALVVIDYSHIRPRPVERASVAELRAARLALPGLARVGYVRGAHGRVPDETAPGTPLDPNHPVFHVPNEIAAGDWDGWVQERGLYFAHDWDAAYAALLETHDPGEPPLQGGLLVARLGRGTYVYTGLSFFRQLPAGVPGAYRLFANLLALGKK